MEIVGTVAQLATAKDASSLQAIAQSVNGGPDAWKLKNTESVIWGGSFVGAQAGIEHLSGTGYSQTRKEYGLFLPLGLGYSYPIYGRPVSLFVSAVDLGSLISTTSGKSASNGSVNSGAKTGWSQLLAPGAYVGSRLLGPVYVGVGYAFKTPGLRSVTLPAGNTLNVDSARLQLFLGVDVTLFSYHP